MMLEDVNSVLELYQLLQDKKDCMFQFLQDESLLHATSRCSKHRRAMTLLCDNSSKIGFCWRCPKYECRKNRSGTYNSFFFFTNMKIETIIICIYAWCVHLPPMKVSTLFGFAMHTSQNVYESIRKICSWQLEQMSEKFRFGGPDKVVEIFQTQFSPNSDWILAIYGREEKRGVFLLVKERDAETLIPLIKKHVLPGTTIHSGISSAYETLSLHGYIHLTPKSFKNSDETQSGATLTNLVKGWWSVSKRKLHSWNVHNRTNLDSYLDAVMWCDLYGREGVKETFKNILSHIRSKYKT